MIIKIKWIVLLIKIHFLKIFINRKRVNSDNYSSKTSIKETKNINIDTQNINQTIILADSQKIIKEIIKKTMPQLREIAIEVYYNHTQEFQEQLLSLMSKLTPESLLKFKEPDTQYILGEATKISGLREEKYLRDLLAKLLIEKIKNHDKSKDNFKNLIFNEAIKTIEILTPNQIKIITLSFLLKEPYYTGIRNLNQYKEYLDNTMKPFIDIDINNYDFEYIDYAGLAILIDIATHDYIGSLRRKWPHIFLTPITYSELETFPFLKDINSHTDLLNKNNNNEYFYNFPNLYSGIYTDNFIKLKEFLIALYSIDSVNVDGIINNFKSHIIVNDTTIEMILLNLSDTSKKIINLCKNTLFKSIRLTTVGRLIAFMNYEQVSGDKLNFDLFLLR